MRTGFFSDGLSLRSTRSHRVPLFAKRKTRTHDVNWADRYWLGGSSPRMTRLANTRNTLIHSARDSAVRSSEYRRCACSNLPRQKSSTPGTELSEKPTSTNPKIDLRIRLLHRPVIPFGGSTLVPQSTSPPGPIRQGNPRLPSSYARTRTSDSFQDSTRHNRVAPFPIKFR